jgi:hypothetical protein
MTAVVDQLKILVAEAGNILNSGIEFHRGQRQRLTG